MDVRSQHTTTPEASRGISVFWTVVALGFLLACDLFLFRDAILEGRIYYRSDTVTYYFPIADRLKDALDEGRILLWTRYLFGGFPLFADGEAGMLYPPNLLAYLTMPAEQAFVWLRVARYFMAAAFTFLYLRTLRLNRFAATVGALTFTFGSFMVTQMHHTNVGNTAVWLPLTLAMVELGLGSTGWRRWLYFTGAGASTGIQALGVHIQPLILSGLFLAAYIPFRVLLCPIAQTQRGGKEWARPLPLVPSSPGVETSAGSSPPADDLPPRPGRAVWLRRQAEAVRMLLGRRLLGVRNPSGALVRRVGLALLLLVLIPTIAFGIAAVQVVPLAELGMQSFRRPGVTYQFATSFSMPVQNLINLIFPYFFRYTNFQYWSLWSEWETTIYCGIGGLVLACIALLFVRSRMVLFFVAAATLGLLLAFGNYSPYPLYEHLWPLPGFSFLRAPGRFTMLVTFSVAVLAAYGVDWLCRTPQPARGPVPDGRWPRFAQAASVHGFALFLIFLLVGMAGVAWWLVSFRIWIEKEPSAVKRLVEQSYLSLRNDRPWLNSDMVLSFLNYSLDPTNPKTTTSLALMLAVFLLLFAWLAFRRLWRIWATLMVGLVAVDLLLFAVDFHPTVRIDQLSSPSPTIRWLMEQNDDGMGRVYTARGVRKTEANRLLPFRISDIDGYSSLETVRHQQFMAKLREFDKPLLDLYGVRFVVLPRQPTALPSYELTAYHPNHPLADGPRTNPGAHVTFYVGPAVKADEVAFISNLRDAEAIPQDAEVAEIVVVDTSGERITLKVRAGRETADWSWDRPDATPRIAHRRVTVADRVWTTDASGTRYQANLYYAHLPLDKTRTVARVEFGYRHPIGAMRLYGMMLWERPGTAHQLLDRNRFVPRYQDEDVQILENPSPLPRAWLVPAARIVDRWTILDIMANGDFDPAKVVLLETEAKLTPSIPLSPPDAGIPDPQDVQAWLEGNPDSSPGTAEIVNDRSTEVDVHTSSRRNALLLLTDSFYPGWKALVDGRPAPIYRADYLFRAVPVPPGEHVVRFVFQPESFELGAAISVLTLSALLVFWTLLIVVGLRRARRTTIPRRTL